MDLDKVKLDEKGAPLEAALTSGKSHPNVVATIAWAIDRESEDGGGADAGLDGAAAAGASARASYGRHSVDVRLLSAMATTCVVQPVQCNVWVDPTACKGF